MGIERWPRIPDRVRSPSRSGPASATPWRRGGNRSSCAKGESARSPGRARSSRSTTNSGCTPPPSTRPSRDSGRPAGETHRSAPPRARWSRSDCWHASSGSVACATRKRCPRWRSSTYTPPRPFAAASSIGTQASGSSALGSGDASRTSRSPRPPNMPDARPGSSSMSHWPPRTSRPPWTIRSGRHDWRGCGPSSAPTMPQAFPD